MLSREILGIRIEITNAQLGIELGSECVVIHWQRTYIFRRTTSQS